MGRRGRKRRLDVESEYWRLLLAGVGHRGGLKQVGIGRKTGYRWRAETSWKNRLAASASNGRLCVSSGGLGAAVTPVMVCKHAAVELAGDASLEAAHGFAAGLAAGELAAVVVAAAFAVVPHLL
jgi:hypothetical protein